FQLRRSSSGRAAAVVSIQRGTLTVGNARAYVGNAERYKVRLFIDKRCLEVYVNDGAVAVYTAVDARPEDRGIAVFARAGGGGVGTCGPTPPILGSTVSGALWTRARFPIMRPRRIMGNRDRVHLRGTAE